MFKKELVNVLKQTGWFIAAVAVVPIPIILFKWTSGPYLAVFIPALQPALVFWSLFLGASLFGRERGQRAMEYALSFPHSRLGLLARLAAPRLLVLLAFILSAWAASRIIGADTTLLPYLPLVAGFCLPLFLVSLSLSVLIENFIALCLLSLLGWYAAGELIFRLLWGSNSRYVALPIPGAFAFPRPDVGAYLSDSSFPLFLFQLILPIVPFVIALLFSISRFDVRRSAGFIKRYIKVFGVGLVLCILTAYLGAAAAASLATKNHYLTKGLKLIEWSYSSNTIRIQENRSTRKVHLDSSLFWSLWDNDAFLFFQDYDGNLQRINLSTGVADRLYRADRKQPSFWNKGTYGTTITCIENGSRPNEIQLVLLDERTKKADRLVFVHDAFSRGGPTLIGTGLRDDRRFWICLIMGKSKKFTLRLWEDGQVEEILVKGRLETVNAPHFINGLLFFTGREPMIVLQDNGRSFELRKEFPAEETFYVSGGFIDRKSLDAPAVSYIYSKRAAEPDRMNMLARMNMATLEIEDIGEWSKYDDAWGYFFSSGGRSYFVGGAHNRRIIEFYGLDEGAPRLIRSFPDTDINRRDTRFRIFDSGIVLTKGKHIGVYAFPDLREIKF